LHTYKQEKSMLLIVLTAAISFWLSQRTVIYLGTDSESLDSRFHFKFAIADVVRLWAAIVAVCSWFYKSGRSVRKLADQLGLITLSGPTDKVDPAEVPTQAGIEVWRKWIGFGPSAGAASAEASAKAGSVGEAKMLRQVHEGE
jgi:hypothetical protein